jgi:tetratricopeptide (TPR) repeat protein
MMIKTFSAAALCLGVCASFLMAQKPKSANEAKAVQAIQQAKTPDERVSAVENLITKFADTEFKGWALNVAAEASDQKGDFNKAIFYGERAIEADPKVFDPYVLVAGELAQHTREFDLDKEEKLGKAEKYAKQAMEIIPTSPKPQPQVTDAQWDEYKKEAMARTHVDLGLIAMARKRYDAAIAEFKVASDSEPMDTVVMVRLANAYNEAGKPDDALGVLNKLLATPNLNPAVKQFAESEKARSEKAKAAKK